MIAKKSAQNVSEKIIEVKLRCREKDISNAGLETNARPLARGELNSVRASGSSDLTSPVGEWEFYGDLSTIS